jgi:hypothetical protein
MSSSKRPSTSSLRRFLISRPYVPVAEIRRRFGIDDPDCMCRVERAGESMFVGLPEREAMKVQDLWLRGEIGLERSVEVRAPVAVGVYPMRLARYIVDANGQHPNGRGPGSYPRPSAQPVDPDEAPSSMSPSLGHPASSN